MKIEVIENEDNIILIIGGELTLIYINLAYETIIKYLGGKKGLVIECREVEDVDLSFFQVLYYIGEKANKEGIPFTIKNRSELLKTKISDAGLFGKLTVLVDEVNIYDEAVEENKNG